MLWAKRVFHAWALSLAIREKNENKLDILHGCFCGPILSGDNTSLFVGLARSGESFIHVNDHEVIPTSTGFDGCGFDTIFIPDGGGSKTELRGHHFFLFAIFESPFPATPSGASGPEVKVERWSAPIKAAVIFERCGFAC